MTVGPRIIFDKSFIQSLNVPLIDELTLYFTATCPPVLISEIIADLQAQPRRDGRLPEDLVRELAVKMMEGHGVEPAPLRVLVQGNLLGDEVPMHGFTVPLLSGAPAVRSDPSRKMMLVDQTVQQEMWQRLARGDFTVDDGAAAQSWRAGIAETDLSAERDRWRPFAEQLGNPTSLAGVVEAVDGVMMDRTRRTQVDLINLVLDVVRGGRAKNSAVNHLMRLPAGTVLQEYAPFAAHVVRLYLCFVVGLARGFIGTRPSNTVDLQYLYYAPFCNVFVSLDRLNRTLWEAGAMRSTATFVWGADIRPDLEQRIARRQAMTPDEWAAHRRVYGEWPDPIEGSIMYALGERHVPQWPRGGNSSPNVGKTINELDDPELIEMIKRAEALSRRRG